MVATHSPRVLRRSADGHAFRGAPVPIAFRDLVKLRHCEYCGCYERKTGEMDAQGNFISKAAREYRLAGGRWVPDLPPCEGGDDGEAA